MEEAHAILGGAHVRAYATGRIEHARMTKDARWVIWALVASGAFFLLVQHVILLPGALILIIIYEEVKPMRGVAVTDTAVVEFRVGSFRALPQTVMATMDSRVLYPVRVRPVGRKMRLIFQSEAIAVRKRDYATLVEAASHLAVAPSPSASAPPPVPPPPSAYAPPPIPPPATGHSNNYGF
jgi:hypothetical protein